jgi:hypothetical protein
MMRVQYKEEDRRPYEKPMTSVWVSPVQRPLFNQDKFWYATPPMAKFPLEKNSRASERLR